MSNEVTREKFINKLRDRTGYLYQVGILATPKNNYLRYAADYIIENEVEPARNKWQLKGIEEITRKKSYKQQHRATKNSGTRGEEWFILDLFEKNADRNKVFGGLVDYQIPLRNTRANKGTGKIDFAFIKNGAFFLAKMIPAYSRVSLLQAIIEIQTYYQIADKEKMLSDYGFRYLEVRKCIVLFSNCKAYKQLANEQILKMIKMFDIEVIVLDSCNVFEQLK
jgi:hypothetical protein